MRDRKEVGQDRKGYSEGPGGVEGGEIVINVYCVRKKNPFSIKLCLLNIIYVYACMCMARNAHSMTYI